MTDDPAETKTVAAATVAAATVATAAVAAALAAPDQRLAPPRPAPARDMVLTGAWLASLVSIVLLGSAAYAWRRDVIAVWPPSARVLGSAPMVAVLTDRSGQQTAAFGQVPSGGASEAAGRHN